MLPVKRSDRGRAARFHDILRIVEPQAQMISLNRVRHRILKGVWNTIRIVKRIARSRSHAWRHDEGFDTESADELTVAYTIFISLDIALVPRKAKRLVRHLNHEQVEVGVGWQSPHFYFHDFNRTDGFDFDPAVRIGRNRGKRVQPRRADEIELEIVTIIIVIAGKRRSG